jgi:hypothetical protein
VTPTHTLGTISCYQKTEDTLIRAPRIFDDIFITLLFRCIEFHFLDIFEKVNASCKANEKQSESTKLAGLPWELTAGDAWPSGVFQSCGFSRSLPFLPCVLQLRPGTLTTTR